MNGIALKILIQLEEKGEMSLEEIGMMLPKKHKDHRDFYIFASLVSIGYIDDYLLVDNEKADPNKDKEQLLAREYFACSTADKKASYKNHNWMISGDNETLKGQTFALSGKGSLFLSEIRANRFDRFFTISTGIIVGIVVAIISAYARTLFNT